MRITVVGGGSWGTAFAALAGAGGPVTLVVRREALARDASAARRNPEYLPELELPDSVRIVHLADPGALEGADVVASAVPSRVSAALAADVARRRPGAGVVCLTKGLDPATGAPLSSAWRDRLGDGVAYCALTGPNHAEEIAAGLPAACVIAGEPRLAARLQSRLASASFRPYVSTDLLGAEICGAAKNVIAVAAGMGEGLGLGDNAKAAVITRGLAEMTRLGVAAGAEAPTFVGLAGLGDLVATCTGRHSRNRRAGELIAHGVAADRIEDEIGQVAEGLWTAESLVAMAGDLGVELPISREVLAALAGKDPRRCLHDLMTREPRREG